MNFTVEKLDDWQAVAQAVASELKPGMILGLSGPLGAGKTTFVQYLADELGAVTRPKSPTFSLLRIHELRATSYELRRLIHIDAYRLERAIDLLPLNLEEELAEPGTVVVIEWPENVRDWLARYPDRYRELKISQKKGPSAEERQAVLD